MKEQTYTAVIFREDDLFVAECPEVGTVGQGKTLHEAVLDLKKATELFLEEAPDMKLNPSWIEVTHFEAKCA